MTGDSYFNGFREFQRNRILANYRVRNRKINWDSKARVNAHSPDSEATSKAQEDTEKQFLKHIEKVIKRKELPKIRYGEVKIGNRIHFENQFGEDCSIANMSNENLEDSSKMSLKELEKRLFG